MGCVMASACASEKEKQRALIIELSPYNIQGENVANAFIRYVKYKELVLNASIIKKEDMNNLICIKYKTYNDNRIIYNGTDFSQMQFDSIYRKIIIMNDD